MSADLDLHEKWKLVQQFFERQVGKKPDLNAVLFLIGLQELGQGSGEFSKEEKQDLMHIATCRILSPSGFYSLDFVDQEGWPHWKLEKELPKMRLKEQEDWLKLHIFEYLEEEGLIGFRE